MIAVESMTMLNSLDLTTPKANGAVTGLSVGSYFLGQHHWQGGKAGGGGREIALEVEYLNCFQF